MVVEMVESAQDEISSEYGLLAEVVSYPADFSFAIYRLRANAKWHDDRKLVTHVGRWQKGSPPDKDGPSSVRWKDFLLVRGKKGGLFDLKNDPGEAMDLTTEKPEIAAVAIAARSLPVCAGANSSSFTLDRHAQSSSTARSSAQRLTTAPKECATRITRFTPDGRSISADRMAFSCVLRDFISVHLTLTLNSFSRLCAISAASATPPYTMPPVTKIGNFAFRETYAP